MTIGRICRHSLLDFMQVRMCTSQMSRKAQERIVSMYHSLEALGLCACIYHRALEALGDSMLNLLAESKRNLIESAIYISEI